MTLKILDNFVNDKSTVEESREDSQQKIQDLIERCRGLQFYRWYSAGSRILSKEKHDTTQFITYRPTSVNNHRNSCCFNHVIGLPTKNGQVKPLFNYEELIVRCLLKPSELNYNETSVPMPDSYRERYEIEKQRLQGTIGIYSHNKLKHLWIKKATGLGITELILRFMAWLCLRNDDYRNSQMVIITGPNWDLAIKLIKRIKGLFEPLGIYFDTKETMLELNGCRIEAYPSNHLASFRSLTNPKFIFVDEADFIGKGEIEEVRHTAERYIAKSDPFIVMVSTPNRPDGLFAKIEKEPFETCIYKRLFLDYTYGINKIYTQEEIDKAKPSPSFEREYCLKYLGLIGNVFSQQSIDNCQKVGLEYNPDNIIPEAKKSIGLDPAWGSSNFALVATQFVNGKIQVIYADEYPRPFFQSMIDKVWELKRQLGNVTNIYVDSANPEIIQTLKRDFREPHEDQYVREKIAWCKKNNLLVENYMKIVPVSFSSDGPNMLIHLKRLLEHPNNLVAINPKFDKLITSLKTAVATEMKLDKESTSYDDILDAFRMAAYFYRVK